MKTALQIVGSPTSQFFYDLSALYAKEVVTPHGLKLHFAIAHPDGKWSITKDLNIKTKKLSLKEFIAELPEVDLAIPHLFCQKGLTSIRIFFEDLLNIPLVGSSGYVADKAQNKQLTKLIAREAGVRVAKGIAIQDFKTLDIKKEGLKLPLIVKPNNSDNSDGLSLAHTETDLKAGVERALKFDDTVLIEEYIPGRELRGAVLEIKGIFTVLPFIEYEVHVKKPIRYAEDKLKFDDSGNLIAQSDKKQIPSICPAQIDAKLEKELSQMMITMHKALGCRDFSMFDFRVHSETSIPYLLETGLFWSFSKTSMISSMMAAGGMDLERVTGEIWKEVCNRMK